MVDVKTLQSGDTVVDRDGNIGRVVAIGEFGNLYPQPDAIWCQWENHKAVVWSTPSELELIPREGGDEDAS